MNCVGSAESENRTKEVESVLSSQSTKGESFSSSKKLVTLESCFILFLSTDFISDFWEKIYVKHYLLYIAHNGYL